MTTRFPCECIDTRQNLDRRRGDSQLRSRFILCLHFARRPCGSPEILGATALFLFHVFIGGSYKIWAPHGRAITVFLLSYSASSVKLMQENRKRLGLTEKTRKGKETGMAKENILD
jgi:hypothetical protein